MLALCEFRTLPRAQFVGQKDRPDETPRGDLSPLNTPCLLAGRTRSRGLESADPNAPSAAGTLHAHALEVQGPHVLRRGGARGQVAHERVGVDLEDLIRIGDGGQCQHQNRRGEEQGTQRDGVWELRVAGVSTVGRRRGEERGIRQSPLHRHTRAGTSASGND